MDIRNDVRYIGVNDHQLDLFEGQFTVENGMAYNSYVILDEKIAVMDTVDKHFTEEWLSNLKEVLNGRMPDYLVVHHMEPDHSSSIAAFLENYPETAVLASMQAFNMMKQFYGADPKNRQVVKDGDRVSLGSRDLCFITAPMVHWPEVVMSYDTKEKILFSADAFGKFGALDVEDEEGWACEARRYYFGIVGKFGVQVQALLKKAAGLDIEVICPLHGPVLTEDLSYYLDLYNTWSAYEPEDQGVAICYTSVYGHTAEAAKLLAEKLKEKGVEKVALNDLARCDMYEAMEDAFRYDRLVLATTTYNTGFFPIMEDFLHRLVDHNYQKRKVALIENGTWAPLAAKGMKERLEKCKDLTYVGETVTIRSAMSDANRAQIEALAEALVK